MVEKTHTKQQDNPAIFKDNESCGWGGDWGGVSQTDRTHPLVMCQSTYIYQVSRQAD